MGEIIHERNSSYAQYEELLVKRDDLLKEAFMWDREYIRTFGDKILRNFEIKIECIRKKKTISFLQTAINHGKSIDMDELQTYLRREMAEYEAQLRVMAKDNKLAKHKGELSEIDLIQIKKIYRRITKKIHPDINPKTMEDDRLRELWERVVTAYKCNNLKDLKELELLVSAALDGLDEVDIPDIETKILEVLTEIEDIKSSDPYLYKFLLDDNTAIEEKNRDLDEEFAVYDEYRIQLEEVLQDLMSSGGATFICQTN